MPRSNRSRIRGLFQRKEKRDRNVPVLLTKISYIRSLYKAVKELFKSEKLRSRKFWVMIAINTISTILTTAGVMSPETCESIVKWITGTWLVSQGLEDGAKRLGPKDNSIPSGIPLVKPPEVTGT